MPAESPLHTLPGLFREDAPEVTLEEALEEMRKDPRGFSDKVFEVDPDDWYADHYREFLESLKRAAGFKVRVPITETWTRPKPGRVVFDMAEIHAAFYSSADLVILSPSPLWPCSYCALSKPWPEFSDGLWGTSRALGTAWFNGGLGHFFAWHAAMRPLIQAGSVAYLPRNFAMAQKTLGLPNVPRFDSDEPYLIAQNAFVDLYLDQTLSERLGCSHVLPNSGVARIVTSQIAHTLVPVPLNGRAHAVIPVKLPIAAFGIGDLVRLQREEQDSFNLFRKSLQLALRAAVAEAKTTSDLETRIKEIERDLIEQPLAALEHKLAKAQRLRLTKWAGYAAVSMSAALVAAIEPALGTAIAGGIGTVSILKIMDMYFADVEKDIQLSTEALYWLAKARAKALRTPSPLEAEDVPGS